MRRDKACTHLHYSICKALGIETTDKQYKHIPKPVCEDGDVTVLWNQAVHTDREVTANTNNTNKTTTTIHTRQLQQYTQDNCNKTHKTTTTIHTRQLQQYTQDNYNNTHKTTATIHTRQLQQYIQDN